MEHRLDARFEMPIELAIHTGTRGTYATRANNLSRGGVNVETNRRWEIRKKGLVLIEFLDAGLSAKIPALVVQTSKISASLMFTEYSPALQSFLNHIAGAVPGLQLPGLQTRNAPNAVS